MRSFNNEESGDGRASPGREYLERVYGRFDGRGYIAVTAFPEGRTCWFATNQLDELYEKQIELGKDQQTYHSWAVMREPLGCSRRGKVEDVVGYPGIFIDLDIQSEHHKETRLPSSHEEIAEFLCEIGFPQPSQVRHSGNGVYFDWLYPEPVFFETPDSRKAHQRSVSAVHSAFKTKAREKRGWFFDSTQDLARITRMPETLNHKNDPPKAVEFIQ